MDKKGQEVFTMNLLLAVVGMLVITGLVVPLYAGVRDKSNQEACRLSLAYINSMSYVSKKVTSATPNCKMDVVTLPLKGKGDSKEDIQRQIADLTSKCWYSHLEGSINKNLLGSNWWGDNNCDVCYRFTITDMKDDKNKDLEKFPVLEELSFLVDEVKVVNAKSDSCYGDGGNCMKTKDECLSDHQDLPDNYIKFNEDSSICKKDFSPSYGCCQSRYSCINKGGICQLSDLDNLDTSMSCENNMKHYSEWSCPTNRYCCVKEENYYSYLDYVQRSKGPGKIVFDPEIKDFYKDDEVYAVSFVTNTDSMFKSSGTVVGILGVTVAAGSVLTGGAIIPAVILIAKTGAVGGVSQAVTDAVYNALDKDINYIYVSKYENVEKKCSILN